MRLDMTPDSFDGEIPMLYSAYWYIVYVLWINNYLQVLIALITGWNM
jgi:hypothetical protein